MDAVRRWANRRLGRDAPQAPGEAAKLLPLEGKGRELVTDHIEFAAACALDLGSVDEAGNRVPAHVDDPDVRELIGVDLMNRQPVTSPTGSKRQRHRRKGEYSETLKLLE